MFVKIVQLPVIRAISFYSLRSNNPEAEAHDHLLDFLKENNESDNPMCFQVFGRNNPISINHPEKRGYEFLLTIPDDYLVENDIPVTFINPRLYAVVASKGIKQMHENWNELVTWIKESSEFTFDYPSDYNYDQSPSLELEHHIDPYNTNERTILIDYYFPIKYKNNDNK